MPRIYYERLSTESAATLAYERSHSFAHSAALLVFEPGPLAIDGHGVDFEAIRCGFEARLGSVPRARQKLRWIPYENTPVWVDDPNFNLEYHLRHTSLPRPGTPEQLRRMVARIHAQRLDRSRPLWECWVLEGLGDGRFALLWKSHHCMVDPTTETDLLESLLSADREQELPPTATWRPRPMPSGYELLRDEVLRQARGPRRALESLGRLWRGGEWSASLELRLRGVAKLLGYTIRPRSDTPLSGPSGPHRRFASLVLPLPAAQRARRVLGVSLNDVLLAVLTGAIHRFFLERLVNPATVDFRVSAPVTLATEGRREDVAEWILELPIWEKDVRERVARIRAQTEALGEANPAQGARTLLGVAEFTGSRRLALGARAISRHLPVDLVMLNVPGPQQTLFFQGARLLQGFGIAPLREDHGLGVTVMSYDGQLCWGLNADFDCLPDLERFAAALEASFEELLAATRSEGHLSAVGDA